MGTVQSAPKTEHFLPDSGRRYVWEWPVRITHWVNVITIPVLFLTGIFIARPVLTPMGEPFNHFWMGRIRQLHFIFAFVLIVSGALRAYWFFVGNNYARSGFPIFWKASWWRAVFHQVSEYLYLNRGHVTLGHNSLAGASYVGF